MTYRALVIFAHVWAVFALGPIVFALENEDEKEGLFAMWKRGGRSLVKFLFSMFVDLMCLPIATLRGALGLPRVYRIILKRREIDVEAPGGFYNPSSRELLHMLDDEELRALKSHQAEVWVPVKLMVWQDTEFLLNYYAIVRRAAELHTERRQRGI